MKKRNHSADVLIAGGGAPGLALALLLARAGISVAVVDPAPAQTKSKPDSRTSALMAGSIAILERTGAWAACREAGGVMRTLTIVDDSRRGPVEIGFHADDIGQDIFGVNMPNAILRDALAAQAAKEKNIRLIHGAKLASFTADDFGVNATICHPGESRDRVNRKPDGNQIPAFAGMTNRELRATLIVGADGRHSAVREAAGIAAKEHDYGQQAITCLISHTRPHNETSTEFHRPSGPFTLVPLPGKTSSVVWVDHNEAAERFMRLDRASFGRALQDRSKGILGRITLEGTPSAWPLKSLKAKSLIAKRAALIAEAAHVLHPLGAQGLNLSLRDAAALADVVIGAVRLGLDPGSQTVLRQYEARRRQDISTRVLGTGALNRMVSTNSTALHGLRRIGLRTLDNVSLLKEIAMRHGMAA